MGKPKGKKSKGDDEFSDDGAAGKTSTTVKDDTDATHLKSGPKKSETKGNAKKKGNRQDELDQQDSSDEKPDAAEKSAKKNTRKSKSAVDDRDNDETAPTSKSTKQKQKKKNQGNESDEDLADAMSKVKLSAASPEPPRRRAARQGFAVFGAGDSSESESDAVLPSAQRKKQVKGKSSDVISDDEDVDIPKSAVHKGKGPAKVSQARGFMMFADDDNEVATASESDEDLGVQSKEKLPAAQTSKSKKEKKKDKKKETKAAADDDDIDAILAKLDEKPETDKNKKEKGKMAASKGTADGSNEIPSPATAAVPVKEMTAEELADELESAQKKKKGKKAAQGTTEEAETPAKAAAADEQHETLVAEQKKKKKGKKGDKASGGASDAVSSVKEVSGSAIEPKKDVKEAGDLQKVAESTNRVIPSAVEVAGTAKEEDEVAADDSKKKKKKKGKEEEKKKPVNKHVEAMKLALAKIKEEEEKARKEAEEQERREEEARRLREEQLRLEEERKLRKKQKEKEKIERKKKEGTFLTEKQKQDRKRAIQLVTAMGMAVPSRDAGPKKPVYGRQRKGKKPEPGDELKDVAEKTTADVEDATEKTTEADVEDFGDNGDDDAAAVDSSLTGVPEGGEMEVASSNEVETAPAADDETEDLKDDWAMSSDDEEVAKAKPVPVAAPIAKEGKTSAAQPVSTNVAKKPAQALPAAASRTTASVPITAAASVTTPEAASVPAPKDAPVAAPAAASDCSTGESSAEESDDEESDDDLSPKERALNRIMKRQDEAEKKRSTDRLRAAVVCVLGHVDTGKTKILDKLRHTNVQDNEAGGITQQIGATNVPLEAIKEQTKMCKEFLKHELKLPGLLIIDTPGHESFSNLRSRGSSLCDIAVLVVDIMHGLEPQTIESIKLLRQKKTPFIVALNKIDRLFQWKTNPHADVVNTIKKQQLNTKQEFEERVKGIIVQFAEQSLNAALFYENKNPREYVSLVPTSAHTGDGMGNLIALVCDMTQTYLAKRVALSDDLKATVMEVKALPGLGTTIDVILVDGRLRVGDTIVVPGIDGPIVTHIRELLLPQPLRELRVKGQYVHNKEVAAAQGVKIVAKELEKALAGLPLYVAQEEDEIEVYKEWLAEALKNALNSIKCSERGVYVQASTLGSLEALLEYLRSVKVPYSGINIGPVHKRDVMRASVMLEHGEETHSCILAFDVKVERDAQEMADNLGVRIFTADIIYHLFDAFQKYQDEIIRKGREENKMIAVFPCKLRILPQYIFNSRDPIVMGVAVEDGFVCPGTPICVPSKEMIELGVVTSVELNHKQIEAARKGQEVCVKIEPIPGEAPKMFGRHFDEKDTLVSKISRNSIDAVKKYFKAEMTTSDWKLMIELKNILGVV